MSSRTAVLLVRHAPSSATRGFTFPTDEPLDERGRDDARTLAGRLRASVAVTSPAARCRETSALAGFPEARQDAGFAELDFGTWAGRDPHEVGREDPDALEAWYRDPVSAPHGGEGLEDLAARVRASLERLRIGPRTVVFTHGGPIKVAVLTALGAPLSAVWNLDVAPCSVTELHARPEGGWTLTSCNVPPGGPA
jgi:broad specificity phosphatase PhoE